MINRKKIIRVKKHRNPSSRISEEGREKIDSLKLNNMLLTAVNNAIVYGSPKQLSNLRVYINQKFKCEDCDEYYDTCECEWCEDCEFHKCLCIMELLEKEWDSSFDNLNENIRIRNKIRKIVWEFAKLILPDKELKRLIQNLRRYDYNTPSGGKNRFIKEISINSSFPKERELMIRLFDLD